MTLDKELAAIPTAEGKLARLLFGKRAGVFSKAIPRPTPLTRIQAMAIEWERLSHICRTANQNAPDRVVVSYGDDDSVPEQTTAQDEFFDRSEALGIATLSAMQHAAFSKSPGGLIRFLYELIAALREAAGNVGGEPTWPDPIRLALLKHAQTNRDTSSWNIARELQQGGNFTDRSRDDLARQVRETAKRIGVSASHPPDGINKA